MKTSSIVRSTIIVILFFLVACEKQDDPNLSDDPDLLSSLYSKADDTLRIETRKYFLNSYLYRDFMPSVPIREKSPLIAVIQLIDLDSTKIPTDLSISKLYVIKGNLIWISNPIEINKTYSDYKIEKVSNNGPEWDTGIYVDIVVEISNIKTNNKSLLISKHQYIDRTE